MITVFGANTSLSELRKVPVKVPKGAGGFWQGIPHSVLLEGMLAEFVERGWPVMDIKIALSKDRADMAAAIHTEIPDLEIPGQTLCCGLLTSNAMKRPLKVVVGSEVKVCMNGMCTGDIVLDKKHTKGLDVCSSLNQSLVEFEEKAREIPTICEGLRNRDLKTNEAERIMVDLGRTGQIGWTKLADLDELYRNPPHEEHGKGSSWTMLQAFTEMVKQYAPMRQMDMINEFRDILPKAT